MFQRDLFEFGKTATKQDTRILKSREPELYKTPRNKRTFEFLTPSSKQENVDVDAWVGSVSKL